MKNTFKYALGDKVFILGTTGICIITGRGKMEFISGGSINYYFLDGANPSCQSEVVLQTPEEAMELIEWRKP